MPDKDIKILWAESAGRCNFSGCGIRLSVSDNSSGYTLGEMAHIRGKKPGSSRYDASQSDKERNSHTNLILLCPTHHTIIDKPENEGSYPANVLHDMKNAHIAWVNSKLDNLAYNKKEKLAHYLLPLLEENHRSFMRYGPSSDIARKNPQSDAHLVWLEERLATIVPNNRLTSQKISENIGLFDSSEHSICNEFLLHARTYERWVCTDASYEVVTRFPQSFSKMIRKLADAST